MASSTFFAAHGTTRPSYYRTPSPPLHAIEPLSPYTPHPQPPSIPQEQPLNPMIPNYERRPDLVSTNGQHTSGHFLDSEARPRSPGKARGHTRSGSTIDTLATVALATSPTFSPLTYNSTEFGASPLDSIPVPTDERPSKRAKSEKAHSPSWQKFGNRPATSHTSVLDSMKTDAELLLNFARPTQSPSLSHITSAQNFNNTSHNWDSELRREQAFVPSHHAIDKYTLDSINRVGSNGSPAVRLRSHSDGAAALSRPVVNGFSQSQRFQSLAMGPVLEDEPSPLQESKNLIDYAVQPIHPPQHSLQHETVASSAAFKSEDAENLSSSQTTCGSCKLDRAPVDTGGDDTDVTWVNCDGCDQWFHIVCAGFKNHREMRTVDKFICRQCRPIHGPTTFVRKSTRPRTAIDYAGLNQGFVKPPTEANEHHYIKPIKEGMISFLPDNFARLSPELVTATYFERGIGMTEPIVIPAKLNPHTPMSALGAETPIPFVGEATTQEEFDAMIDKFSEEVIDCGQDALDMVLPDGLTVKTVGELYGPEERIEVIDVKSQQGEDKRWHMQKWVDYYYDPNISKTVRNVISLEVSQCPLGRLIRRPDIVRKLDLQDSVWPAELQAVGDYPKVQFYCLMSVANCYTDFHIDFGGSSVYYHILKGKKTFFFIPPSDKNLKKYEEWCNSASQDSIFLGNETKECYRVDLSEGDTMLIPSGWIHAVWTPEDSLVIGGNFLTRMNYGMQLKITKIEKDTKVPRKFRYPHFQKIMWYAAIKYLADDPIPFEVQELFARDENYMFTRESPIYYEMSENSSNPGSEYHNSRFYSQSEVDGLPELAKYILRTALIAGGYKVDGVTKDARNAVTRSIPKGIGDPVEIAKQFAVWIAWKRGNEPAPSWTRPGAITMDAKVDISDKRRNTRPSRRSNRMTSVNQSRKPTPAVSEPPIPVPQTPNSSSTVEPLLVPSCNGTVIQTDEGVSTTEVKQEDDASSPSNSKVASLGPKRVACDSCRKRRIRCRHKTETNNESGDLKMAVDSSTKIVPTGESPTGFSELVDGGENDASPVVDDKTPSHSPEGAGIASTKVAASPSPPGSGKKGRVKACDECRKSKRRCIHDITGRINPVKVQDRPKTKRTRSDEEKRSPSKRLKSSSESIGFHKQATNPATTPEETDSASSSLGRGVPDKSPDAFVPTLIDSSAPQPTPARLVSPPTSLADGMDGRIGQPDAEKGSMVGDGVNGDYPISIHTPTSIAHVPSRNNPPSVNTTSTDNPKPHPIPKPKRNTPSATQVAASPKISKSPSSRPGSSHRTKNDSGFHNINIPGSSHRQGKGFKHDRASFPEADADEDSIKLIRQLQEEDFGLRRRCPKS
ncbi:JmjC domain-containing histone demethylation protein 1 [Myotisia sp. PD_48]|nr:JmjC domain-containing histone demethylation protein 1 [Myotisia sp. PD_48]